MAHPAVIFNSRRIVKQPTGSDWDVDTSRLVEAALSGTQKCRGHCDQQASLRFLSKGETLVAASACPAGYVSRLMAYGPSSAGDTLRELLKETLGGLPVKEGDIRVATRHAWDLGIAGAELRAAYWTQNYRASEIKEADRPALFLCSSCGSAYVKQLSASGSRCPSCTGSEAGRP